MRAATAGRRTTFQEVMEGTMRLTGEPFDRPVRLELRADLPGVLHPLGDLEGPLHGRVVVGGPGSTPETGSTPGTGAAPETADALSDRTAARGSARGAAWADDDAATGTLRVAPITARRIRYRLDFETADGRRMRFDGWKSVAAGHPVRTMTTLPATVTDADGTVAGTALLRFDVRRDLARFLAGFRFPRRSGEAGAPGGAAPRADAPREEAWQALRSRWTGQPHRLEVWYTTLTDPLTGTGVWLHHELVAPSDGGVARAHGWAAVFPPGETPVFGRFGPTGWESPADGFAAGDVVQTADRLTGTAGAISWTLTQAGGGVPLYTFPRWAWERELLPAAQMLPAPTATFDGTVRFGDRELRLSEAPGGGARIYGHGNARQWCWLHADLGDGDVCEVVAAVSTRPGLNRLPALPFVRLRVGGREWPAGDPLLAALRMRARTGLPTWSVRGRIGDRRIEITVTQRPLETVSVDYSDPDGAPAVCHNSERADATITVYRRGATGRGRRRGPWRIERQWRLDGTAHAEVGLR